MLNLDEKQLKALHTRANLRRFLECVNGSHVEKIAKMCAKGLDPNFHCPETGDTPLTLATGTKKPNKLLIALVNGGALLDYRNRLVIIVKVLYTTKLSYTDKMLLLYFTF